MSRLLSRSLPQDKDKISCTKEADQWNIPSEMLYISKEF